MCCASSDDYFTEPAEPPSFESVQNLVQSEFEVTESYLEHNIPTFIVKHDENSKEASTSYSFFLFLDKKTKKIF